MVERTSNINKELEKERDWKKRESERLEKLNSRKANYDKIRTDTKLIQSKIEEEKTITANRAKELQGYET